MQKISLLMLWIIIGVLSRILPHPADMTALTSLSLLASLQFSRMKALSIVVLTLLGSDLILVYTENYPLWGDWSWFTYSGYTLIVLAATLIHPKCKIRLFGSLFTMSFFYWIWTNLGTWLLSGLYEHGFSGAIECYTAALPFLRNSLIGDLAWMGILLGAMKLTYFQLPLAKTLLLKR